MPAETVRLRVVEGLAQVEFAGSYSVATAVAVVVVVATAVVVAVDSVVVGPVEVAVDAFAVAARKPPLAETAAGPRNCPVLGRDLVVVVEMTAR